MDIVVATNNKGKLRELGDFLNMNEEVGEVREEPKLFDLDKW